MLTNNRGFLHLQENQGTKELKKRGDTFQKQAFNDICDKFEAVISFF